MDLMDRMLDYLESGPVINAETGETLNLFSTFKVDILDDASNTLTVRNAPSSPSDRFFDRGKENVIMFQILSKNISQRTASQTLYDISKALENLVDLPSQDGSYLFSKIELNTNPTFVDVTSSGSYIYTALFNAHIFTK